MRFLNFNVAFIDVDSHVFENNGEQHPYYTARVINGLTEEQWLNDDDYLSYDIEEVSITKELYSALKTNKDISLAPIPPYKKKMKWSCFGSDIEDKKKFEPKGTLL